MFEDLTWLKVAIVLGLSLVLQDVLLNQIVILGAHPDLMIALPVSVAIVAGAEIGAVIGFLAGGAADLLVSTPFGLSAFVFALVGYLVGAFVNSPLGHDFYNARLSGTGLGALFGTFCFALTAALVGQPGILTAHLLSVMVVVGVSAFVFAPGLFMVWRWALSGLRTLGFGPRMPSSGSALR